MRKCYAKLESRHVASITSTLNDDSSAMITAKVGGSTMIALLDSGAGPSVIGNSTLSSIADKGDTVEKSATKICAVGNTEMSVEGSVNLFDCGDPCYQIFMVLSTEEPTLILGRDYLKKFNYVTFDWDAQRIQLGKNWLTTNGPYRVMQRRGPNVVMVADPELSVAGSVPPVDVRRCAKIRKFSERTIQ